MDSAPRGQTWVLHHIQAVDPTSIMGISTPLYTRDVHWLATGSRSTRLAYRGLLVRLVWMKSPHASQECIILQKVRHQNTVLPSFKLHHYTIICRKSSASGEGTVLSPSLLRGAHGPQTSDTTQYS